MCSTSTPSKATRALMVPNLDTKSPIDNLATALTYGGLYTPPQSANDSRRPSLQYAWSDAQPSTPVHRIHHGPETFLREWSEMDGTVSGSGGNQVDTPFVDGAFHTHAVHTPPVSSYASSSNGAQFSAALAFSTHLRSDILSETIWTQPVGGNGVYNPQATYLGSELFPMSSDLPFRNEMPPTSHSHVKSEFQDFDPDLDVTAQQGCFPVDISYYQNPQVVVPSQLAPEEVYCQSQVAEYGSPCRSSDEYLSSFAGPGIAAGSFEALDPPSPMEAYVEQCDEEDFLLVKSEDDCRDSKTLRSTTRRSAAITKRRTSKRARNGKQPWHSHESFGIEVHCEGTHFRLDGPVKYDTSNIQKPHACTFVKNGKECGTRFKRSEHLKRHAVSHADRRMYPCPLLTCELKIQRPDNACDHFKSHLRPMRPGKRNPTVEWAELQQALLDVYDEKKARKMIDNLQRWIDAGMPEPPGSRQAS